MAEAIAANRAVGKIQSWVEFGFWFRPSVSRFYSLRPLFRFRSDLIVRANDGYAASVDETRSKLRHDFFYVKHCSLHLDVLIVWRTIITVMTGFGSR